MPQHDDIIKGLCIQKRGKLLAFFSGAQNDSIKLVEFTKEGTVVADTQQVQRSVYFKSIPSKLQDRFLINIMKWSPNDEFLAVASDLVYVYQYQQGGQLQKLQQFKDHELDINQLCWDPASSKIATGSQDGRIVIRSIVGDCRKIKEISDNNKVLGLVWDTYDRYLAALYSSNNVVVWQIDNWSVSYRIDLNSPLHEPLKYGSKREDRKIDWSPDYRYILVPTLEDKIVPMVAAIDRNDNFQVKQIFMGPFSSINCVKFNPRLFRSQGCIINVFALGDSDGNITVWGIGDKFKQ